MHNMSQLLYILNISKNGNSSHQYDLTGVTINLHSSYSTATKRALVLGRGESMFLQSAVPPSSRLDRISTFLFPTSYIFAV